jgi:hypothetical protein
MGVLLFKGGVGVGMLKWQTSASPTLWERGVGAHGGAPCRASPSPACGRGG